MAWLIIKVTLLKSRKEFSHGLNTDKHGFFKLSVKIRVSSVANKNSTQIPMENEPSQIYRRLFPFWMK
jgi:hypothetical protein